jgi:arylsulfatase A-like enzyme
MIFDSETEKNLVPTTTVSGVQRPNVVIILADDLGWGDLSCYGAERISTPHIDRLAEQGVKATDAHASSSVCTPSRYSLMTGRYAWRSPLSHGVLGPHGPAIIEPSRPTIASVLKAAGYATGAFGKWHLGLGWHRKDGTVADAFGPDAGRELLWDGRKPSTDTGDQIDYSQPFTGGPTDLGFDRFFGISGSLDMPPYCFLDQDRTLGIPTMAKPEYAPGQRFGYTVPGWKDDEVDLEFVARAIEWVDSIAGEPFFLYLSTSAPHRPCVPPSFARGRTQAGPRGDAVFLVDWVVGQVTDTLDRLGIADQTLVIFTSDNGATLLFPEEGDPSHHPNGHWRGQKADVWEGGHREPLVARWPRRFRPGRVIDDLVCLTDLLPTIADAADADLPDGSAADGRSILDLLTGEPRSTSDTAAGDVIGSDGAIRPPQRELVHQSGNGGFAVRRGEYKALFTTGSSGFSDPVGQAVYPPGQGGQLYNLTSDPAERNNLWESEPEVARELFDALRATGACVTLPASGSPGRGGRGLETSTRRDPL